MAKGYSGNVGGFGFKPHLGEGGGVVEGEKDEKCYIWKKELLF